MSGAEQFKAAVPERSGPTDWRGGLERSGARRGRAGRLRVSVTAHARRAREKRLLEIISGDSMSTPRLRTRKR